MKNYVVKSPIYRDSTICADGFDIENGVLNFYIDNHHVGSFQDWINVVEESPTQSPLIRSYEKRLKEKNAELEKMFDANKSMAESLIEQVKETMNENSEVERLMNKVKNLEKRLENSKPKICRNTVKDPSAPGNLVCTLPKGHDGWHQNRDYSTWNHPK